jgi:hypothetical protein
MPDSDADYEEAVCWQCDGTGLCPECDGRRYVVDERCVEQPCLACDVYQGDPMIYDPQPTGLCDVCYGDGYLRRQRDPARR